MIHVTYYVHTNKITKNNLNKIKKKKKNFTAIFRYKNVFLCLLHIDIR